MDEAIKSLEQRRTSFIAAYAKSNSAWDAARKAREHHHARMFADFDGRNSADSPEVGLTGGGEAEADAADHDIRATACDEDVPVPSGTPRTKTQESVARDVVLVRCVCVRRCKLGIYVSAGGSNSACRGAPRR